MEKLIDGKPVELEEIPGGPVEMWRLAEKKSSFDAIESALALDEELGGAPFVNEAEMSERQKFNAQETSVQESSVQESIDEINRFIQEDQDVPNNDAAKTKQVELISLSIF